MLPAELGHEADLLDGSSSRDFQIRRTKPLDKRVCHLFSQPVSIAVADGYDADKGGKSK